MSLPASSQVFFPSTPGNSSPEVHAGPSTLKAEITAVFFFLFSPRWLQNQLAHIFFFFNLNRRLACLSAGAYLLGLSLLFCSFGNPLLAPRAVLGGERLFLEKKIFLEVIDGERLDAGETGTLGLGAGALLSAAWR